ncbi:MAG: Cna B-type domain-containing protein, partial [Clostridia bacterium]|nr:Cna B-type domain-containing protein [Clostridia bacterium]
MSTHIILGNISGFMRGKVATIAQDDSKVHNSYYVNGIEDIDLGPYGYKYVTGTQITEEQLGSREFFDTLNVNGVWLYREGESPVLKMPATNANEITELNVTNKYKEYKITTDVKEINGTKGGSISGEDEYPYETVRYSENNTKEIKMTPDEGYSIIDITVNGESISFDTANDGSYTMPANYFKNMTEDKQIVVTYAREGKEFTVEKIDKKTREKINGAEFELFEIGSTTSDITNYTYNDLNQYKFTYNSDYGKYVSNNTGEGTAGTTANSYMTFTAGLNEECFVELEITITGNNKNSYGYATTSTYISGPTINESGEGINEFFKSSGPIENGTFRSGIVIYKGQGPIFLNFGYKKAEDDNSDGTMIINKIMLYSLKDKNKFKITENGEKKLSLPEGNYSIKETKAPDGYKLNQEAVHFEVIEDGERKITIENEKAPQINVNHYLWTPSGITTTKVAESNTSIGILGENYTISPKVDIEYEIITNKDYYGNKTESEIISNINTEYGTTYTSLGDLGYKEITDESDENFGKTPLEQFLEDLYIPENASGTFAETNKDVNYYYKVKTYTLTVKHLLEGTEDSVPSKTGGIVADEITDGYVKYVDDVSTPNSKYTTEESSDIDYNKYELVEVPENAIGAITEDTIVRYYYRIKKLKIETKVNTHEETDLAGNTIEVKGGTVSGEDVFTYETVTYGEDSSKDIIALPEEGYEVKSITVNGTEIEFTPNGDKTVTLNKFIEMTEDKEVEVEFRKIQGTVIVHHYEEGTTNAIDLKNGTKAVDETKTGNIGEIYASKPNENAQYKYVVVNEKPQGASGTFVEGTTEVTYYYRVQQTGVTVTKVWSDNNNSLGIRPTSVNVRLSAYTMDGTTKIPYAIPAGITTEVSLNNGTGTTNGSNWTYNWQGLELVDNSTGKTIIYTVEEVPLEGNLGVVYSAVTTVDESNPYNLTITNTYTAPTEKINFVVNKTWEDNSNANSKRPSNLVFNIKKVVGSTNTQVATYTINTASETSHTFELDRYDNKGNEIVYIAEEAEKESGDLYFYTTTGGTTEEITLSGRKAYKAEFTNTFTVPDVKITVPVTKEWSDNTNENEKRPSSVKLVLYKVENTSNVRVTDYTLSTPTTSNTQSYTFTNLPKYDTHGNEIVYTVDEEEVTTDDLKFYSKAIQETNATTHAHTITNTFTVPEDKIEIEAEKIWSEQNETQRQRRPSSVILKLTNGATVVNTDTANSTNSWKVTFSNLAKYDSHGNEIQYRLDEQEVTEGDLKFYTKGTSSNLIKVDDSNYTLSLTNTFTKPDDTIELTVNKQWDDENGKDRLNGIRLVLTGNGQRYAQNLTSSNVDPTNSNNWVYTFQSLPKYNNNGEEIVYTLTEEEATSGDLDKYISNIEGYTATNKLILRETSITKTGTQQITSLDGAINYNISYEAKVDKGYNDEVTLTITDTLPYEIDTTKEYNLNGGKYDAGNKKIEWKATYNPEANKVTYKKWEENTWKTDTEVTLGEQTTLNNVITITKDISLVYKELPVNIPNNKITNTVKGKIELTNNVTEEVEETFDTGVNFKRNIIVTKVWKGDTLNIATRPTSATVQLKKGDVIDRAETLNESNNWKVTWLDLPKYDEATKQEIVYTVTESSVPEGYYLEITEEDVTSTGANNLGFVVTNNKYGSIKITKVDKANEEEKLAGAEITLQKLKQEGSNWVVDETVATRTLTTSSETATLGEVTFNNLTYGKYRVKETKAPEGYQLLR